MVPRLLKFFPSICSPVCCQVGITSVPESFVQLELSYDPEGIVDLSAVISFFIVTTGKSD